MAHLSKRTKTRATSLTVKGRLQSIGYALSGIRALLRSEPNIAVHSIATFIVLCCAVIRNLNKTEWCCILFAIGIVWVAEAFNTAVEKLCDLYTTAVHPLIKTIKDIAAAGVLLAAATSAAIGIIIFFC